MDPSPTAHVPSMAELVQIALGDPSKLTGMLGQLGGGNAETELRLTQISATVEHVAQQVDELRAELAPIINLVHQLQAIPKVAQQLRKHGG